MTTPSRIDGLPDLPKKTSLWYVPEINGYTADQMQAYARTAILADRAARAVNQVPAGAHTEHDELGRDEDGEISLDWQNKAGDMLSMSLGKDGRLSWAVHRAGPNGSGTAQLNTHAYRLLNDVLTECEAASPIATDQVAPEVAEAGQVEAPAKALRRKLLSLGYSDTAVNAMGQSTTMMQRAIDARAQLATLADKEEAEWIDSLQPGERGRAALAATPASPQAPAPQAVVGEAP